jgi:ACR3 family arsenite transporter
MFFNLLAYIKKYLIYSILIAMVLGVVVGYFINDVSILKKAILPLTIMMVYPMMVTLKFSSLLQKGNIKLQVVTQLINFIVFPLIAFGIGIIFFKDSSALRLGLLLMSLLPTSGMTISWTVMSKGNVSEAIRMVVIGLLLGALLIPVYITVLLGSEVDVPVLEIVYQILLVVIVPLVVAFLTQFLLRKKYGDEKFNKSIKPKFPLFSILGVVLIIFTIMTLKAKILVKDPTIILEMIIPLILFYGATFFIPLFIGKKFFNKEDAIALSNGTLVRNLSLAIVIIVSVFPGSSIAALMIAIAYVIQVQLAAFNSKISATIYN